MTDMQLIGHRVALLEEHHDEMKTVLKELTVAINKLAIVDERQVQSISNIQKLTDDGERIRVKLEDMSKRIVTVEHTISQHKQTNQWVIEAVKGMAILAALFVAKQVGLI